MGAVKQSHCFPVTGQSPELRLSTRLSLAAGCMLLQVINHKIYFASLFSQKGLWYLFSHKLEYNWNINWKQCCVNNEIWCQCVLQSQCQNLLCSSLRGCAKAGETVLVHGASGGVSIRGKWQRTLLSVLAPASSWDGSYGHSCINRLADWVFISDTLGYTSLQQTLLFPITVRLHKCRYEIPSQRITHRTGVCCRW